MVELKKEYPVKMDNCELNYQLIKHWAEDENGNRYYIRQDQTSNLYPEATDYYPCRFTYSTTNEIIKDDEEENVEYSEDNE